MAYEGWTTVPPGAVVGNYPLSNFLYNRSQFQMITAEISEDFFSHLGYPKISPESFDDLFYALTVQFLNRDCSLLPKHPFIAEKSPFSFLFNPPWKWCRPLWKCRQGDSPPPPRRTPLGLCRQLQTAV